MFPSGELFKYSLFDDMALFIFIFVNLNAFRVLVGKKRKSFLKIIKIVISNEKEYKKGSFTKRN